MKIKFLASGVAPDYYTINGDVIVAHTNGQTERYDFSGIPFEEGEIVVETDGDMRGVRDAKINSEGEIEVVLCQRVGPGHWSESSWIDASEYNPKKRYVRFDEGKSFTGIPIYYTIDGKQVYGGSN